MFRLFYEYKTITQQQTKPPWKHHIPHHQSPAAGAVPRHQRRGIETAINAQPDQWNPTLKTEPMRPAQAQKPGELFPAGHDHDHQGADHQQDHDRGGH